MAAKQAKLVLPSNRTGTRIEIDGHDVAGNVQSIVLTASHSQGPRLVLDVPVHAAEVEADVTVDIPDSTRAVLLLLGWTPPPSDGQQLPEPRSEGNV